MSDLIQRLNNEADLCRNDGADDIARLLDEAAEALTIDRLAAVTPPTVPEGWKLVPVEPTEDMLFAAELSKPRGYRDLYAAMLAAAPTRGA